jgi:hypothetical protein
MQKRSSKVSKNPDPKEQRIKELTLLPLYVTAWQEKDRLGEICRFSNTSPAKTCTVLERLQAFRPIEPTISWNFSR